jgi:hypothetical protein
MTQPTLEAVRRPFVEFTMLTIQLLLADYIRSLASWRRQRFDDPDRDPRNLQSAAGLDAFAEFVLALPDDDPRLERIRELAVVGERLEPGQQARVGLARFHFHHTETSFDGMLSHFIELLEADIAENGNFGGRLPEGDDPWSPRVFRIES